MSETMNTSDLEIPIKKKRRRLSVDERIMIIDRLAAGYSNGRLAREFGVSGAAISKIGKNIENYINYTGDNSASRKKVTDHTAFEKAIFKWYKQKRCLGEPVPVNVLRDKAIELNRKLTSGENFRAGTSWIQRFKFRYNIHKFPIQKSDIQDEYAVKYCNELIKLIENHNIDPDNIYNADETVLAWRSIPKERSWYKRKNSSTNIETITIMLCSNATGTHKIPLLVIGADELQDSVNNKPLPLLYKTQKNGLMDEEIFLNWYTELFLPEIRERHANDNDRCILLIDSAPPHLSPEILNKIDNICDVRPIHFEISPQIQPLNQGIIRKVKGIYKTKLIDKLLEQKDLNIDLFCNSLNLPECCDYLAYAWDQVNESDTKGAWQNVIVREEQRSNFEKTAYIANLVLLLRKLPSCSRYNVYNTKDWIEEELDQPGWQVLSDDEIINEILKDHRAVIKQYESEMQNNKEKKKYARKPLENTCESSSNTVSEEVKSACSPSVVIKEEIEEVFLFNESEVKQEEDEEELAMQQNSIFLDEYNDNQPLLEDEPEEDRLNDQASTPVIVDNTNVNGIILNNSNNVMITDALTEAIMNFYPGKQAYNKNTVPSAFDAMASIDIVYKWFEKKMECKQEDLIRLRQMREIARKEILVTVNKP